MYIKGFIGSIADSEPPIMQILGLGFVMHQGSNCACGFQRPNCKIWQK
jgi:hypothetical protein